MEGGSRCEGEDGGRGRGGCESRGVRVDVAGCCGQKEVGRADAGKGGGLGCLEVWVRELGLDEEATAMRDMYRDSMVGLVWCIVRFGWMICILVKSSGFVWMVSGGSMLEGLP